MKKFFILAILFFSPIFATTVTIDPDPELTPKEETIRELPESYQKVLFKTVILITVGISGVFLLMLALKRFSSIRFSSLNQQSYIKIIERRPLSSKSALYLVQIGNQKVLIAESQLEIKKISDLDKKEL